MSAENFLNSEEDTTTTKPAKPTRKRRVSKNTSKKAADPAPKVVEEVKDVVEEKVEEVKEVVEPAPEAVEEKVVEVIPPDEAFILNFFYDHLTTNSDKVLNYSGKMYRMFFGRVGRGSKDINYKPVNHIMAPNNSYLVEVTNDGLSVGDQITCPLLGVTPEDVTYTGENYVILNNGPNRVALTPGKPILYVKD